MGKVVSIDDDKGHTYAKGHTFAKGQTTPL